MFRTDIAISWFIFTGAMLWGAGLIFAVSASAGLKQQAARQRMLFLRTKLRTELGVRQPQLDRAWCGPMAQRRGTALVLFALAAWIGPFAA